MKIFTGRTAVITGATGGIGYAIAEAMSNAGANLHLFGRDKPKLENVANNISLRHGNAVDVHCVDLRKSKKLIHALKGLDGVKLDFLIHSAGQIYISNIEKTSSSDHERLFDVNYRAPCEITRLLLPNLRECAGTIVFINSSTSQQTGKPGLAAYSASKLALKAWSDCLRAEENSNGLRVINIFPGRTASTMQEAIHQFEGKAYVAGALLQPSDIADTVIHVLDQPDTSEITDICIRPFQKN